MRLPWRRPDPAQRLFDALLKMVERDVRGAEVPDLRVTSVSTAADVVGMEGGEPRQFELTVAVRGVAQRPGRSSHKSRRTQWEEWHKIRREPPTRDHG